MLYVLDSSWEKWDHLWSRSHPLADADGCYLCEGGIPDGIASVRGDGLVIYYSYRHVLRLGPEHHWLAKLTWVDPEDRFPLALLSAQMDAFRMVLDRLSSVTDSSGLEYLWDIPEAIDLLEKRDAALARYLRDSSPFPFVEGVDASVWPFVKVVGNYMQSIHIYGSVGTWVKEGIR